MYKPKLFWLTWILMVSSMWLATSCQQADPSSTLQTEQQADNPLALSDLQITAGLIYRTLDQDWEKTAEVDQLITKAASEGAVHVTTYDQDQVDALCAAFTAQFNIKCEGRGIRGAQILSTLTTEHQAREAATDVIYLSMSQAKQILDRGLIANVDWETLGISPQRIWSSQGKGNAVAISQSQYAHFYNKDYVDEEDLPQTLEAWLDPKFQGKSCSPDFLFRAGSGFIALLLGMDATVDLGKKLINEQNMVITSFCDPLLLSGERPLMFLGYGNPPSLLESNKIGQFWNAGLGVNLFSLMIPNNSSRPNAARLFAAWASSRHASKVSYDAIGQGWAAYGHGPERLVSGEFAKLNLVYESPLNFAERGRNTAVFEERVFGPTD